MNKSYLYRQVLPTVFNITTVSLNDSIKDIIKLSAREESDYLIVLEDSAVRGVIQLKSLLINLDNIDGISLKDFICTDYILLKENELYNIYFQQPVFRYIVIYNNNEYSGLIDLHKISPNSNDKFRNYTIALYNSILNYSSNGIIAIDKERIVVVINKVAAELYGVKEDDIIDKPIDHTLYSFLFESDQSTEVFNINDRYIKPIYTPLTNHESLIGGLFILKDVTESIKNEEFQQLKNNDKIFENVLESSYDGIYITDINGLTLQLNKSYERITGIDRSRLLGKYMDDLVSSGLLSVSITRKVVEQQKPVTVNQVIKNGKNVIITGSPIYDDKGNISKVITNVRDRTELIELEKRLKITSETSDLYQKELFKDLESENIICQSSNFAKTLELAKKVSTRDSSVLILGETGTGKDVIARFIHTNSNRKKGPYIKINCGAIPANLLESELFGYVGGAFTGASPKGKIGMFEMADEGTLFLDEIGEMPLDLQSALLRVLQDGEIMRVGDSKSRKINVRIIAATNRDLKEMIENGLFRKDLFYRLNVVSIHIPPLRERLEDIPALAEHFIKSLNEKYCENKVLTSNFIQDLLKLKWPGNIRELSNFIEKQFVISDEYIMDSFTTSDQYNTSNKIGSSNPNIIINGIIPLTDAVKEVESVLTKRAMEKGKTTYKAAEILKVSQPTFFRKYRKYHEESE